MLDTFNVEPQISTLLENIKRTSQLSPGVRLSAGASSPRLNRGLISRSSARAGWRNAKHAAQWPSTLATYVYPVFGGLPVAAIDTGLVMKAIEPIWSNKPETASRVRGRIESVLDWARARGHREGDNPARWRGHLDNLLPKPAKAKQAALVQTGRGEHHAALPYADLPAFMAELRARDGLAARALEFAILTAARTGEVIGATWQEIDAEARVWVVPGTRMKAGRDHRVPVAGASMALLASLPRQGAKVFGLSNMALAMTLRRMGRGDLTVHGFRSTFRIGAPSKPPSRPRFARWR
jgi:integrase